MLKRCLMLSVLLRGGFLSGWQVVGDAEVNMFEETAAPSSTPPLPTALRPGPHAFRVDVIEPIYLSSLFMLAFSRAGKVHIGGFRFFF